jgi:Trk K+ transport system NAD-binding subunit
MKVVIVGGGRMGKQLADTLPNSIIVENDHSKIRSLQNTYGEGRIVEGTGTSEDILRHSGIEEAQAIVIATDDDHTNYMVALIAERYNVPKVVVRVDDPQNVDIFHHIGIETVICPAIIAARMINSALYPHAREVSEIHIFDESPLMGKRMGDICLSDKCMVAAILRGHNLLRPDEDIVLQKGDHMIVCSTSGVAPATEDIISDGESKLRPFDSILAFLRDEKDLELVLKETLCLASNFDIGLTVVSQSDALLEEAKKMGEESGVSINSRKADHGSLGQLTEKDFHEVQCAALSGECGHRNRKIETKELMKLIDSSHIPLLICRGGCPYKRIITFMGAADLCERSACIALKIALLTGGELHVMNCRDPEDLDQEKMLNLKRMGNMYGLRVKEEIVEGNPTIEFVSRVTSGEFDLAVINWESGILKKDVRKRMCFEAPMSLLIYTE